MLETLRRIETTKPSPHLLPGEPSIKRNTEFADWITSLCLPKKYANSSMGDNPDYRSAMFLEWPTVFPAYGSIFSARREREKKIVQRPEVFFCCYVRYQRPIFEANMKIRRKNNNLGRFN